MSFQPINTESPFLATTTFYPDDQADMAYAMVQDYGRIAQGINNREIASYQTFESVTGQQWPTPSYLSGVPYAFNMSFRILVPIPALALGLNLIPHTIPGVTSQFIFTKQMGSIGNGALWVACPNDNIHLEVDSVNVRLTIPAAYVGFSGNVILEYLKSS